MTTKNEPEKASAKVSRDQYGGAPANALFAPVVVVLAVLNIAIIVLMFSIFTESGTLAQVTQEASVYTTDATSLLAGSSVLSETSSNYVLKPLNSAGEPNTGPLNAYASEMLQADRRGDQVLARYETYNVSDEVLQKMTEAAESSNGLIDLQTHAIALVSSVYPLPDTGPLAGLELPALSAEEAALPDSEKLALAQTLVLNEDWGKYKSSVSTNVNEAVASIRASSDEKAAEINQTIVVLRTLLIVVSSLIIVVLVFSLFLFYRMLVSPLGRFAHLIVDGKALDDTKGLREMRLLAGSYNDLSSRRDTLEAILREAAETDTLTGLPNRYSLQQHRLEVGDKGYSLAVFLFDLDYLKQTNDTLGHAAGDNLIKRAADCISTCFAKDAGGRCYRLGGDEFAAIVKNIDEDKIDEIVEKFTEMLKENDVSVSWGYSYTKEIGEKSFNELMDEADKCMYEMKQKAHRNDE